MQTTNLPHKDYYKQNERVGFVKSKTYAFILKF